MKFSLGSPSVDNIDFSSKFNNLQDQSVNKTISHQQVQFTNAQKQYEMNTSFTKQQQYNELQYSQPNYNYSFDYGNSNNNNNDMNNQLDVDQKIMESIQNYISQYLPSPMQQQQQIPDYRLSQTQPTIFSPQQTQTVDEYHKAQQVLDNIQPQQPKIYSDPYNDSKQDMNNASQQFINIEEYNLLKSIIENLTGKIDGLQDYTKSLQQIIEAKDKEIQKIRSIQNFTKNGKDSEVRLLYQMKKKRDFGCQTVVSEKLEHFKENDNFSYLYDKDQTLIRSEKDALLKYMRNDVQQNQVFLERIRELESDNRDLEDQIANLEEQISKSQQTIQDQIDNQRRQFEIDQKKRKTFENTSIECNIITEQDLQLMDNQINQLTEQTERDKNQINQLKFTLQNTEEELKILQDTTNKQLYQEVHNLRQQVQELTQSYEYSEQQVLNLSQENSVLFSENQKMSEKLQMAQVSSKESIERLRIQNQQMVDKLTQERDKSRDQNKEKDIQIMDLNQKIEEQTKYIGELEEIAKKKKNKTKKSVDCVNCLKKDVEIQGLTAKLDKKKYETTTLQADHEKQLKQKQEEMKAGQSMIESLTRQIQMKFSQENNSNGNNGSSADQAKDKMIEKLANENLEYNKMIDQMKKQMERQAQQYMMLMEQQAAQAFTKKQ